MKRIYTYLLTALLMGVLAVPEAKAQDPEFTQFYANPLYLNPAFAGSNFCPRFNLNYRNQWPSLSGSFITTSASYDQHITSIYGGLGLMVTNDRAGEGTLNSTTVNAMYSYNQPISREWSIRFGVQASYFQKSLDWNKLTFGDMIDPRRGFVYQTNDVKRGGTVGNMDFSAGILVFNKSFFAGFSAHHLTQPNESLITGTSPLPIKYSAHAGAVIPLRDGKYSANNASISPNILYRSQGTFQQLNLGVYVNTKSLVFGAWYRNKDSFIALIGVQTEIFRFGYSYDITVSRLTNQSGGSHEISAQFNIPCKPPKKRFRIIDCPSF